MIFRKDLIEGSPGKYLNLTHSLPSPIVFIPMINELSAEKLLLVNR